MLITKYVEVKPLHGQKHYESKGYVIPRKENGSVDRDITITVRVEDLPEKSSFEVEYICSGCNENKKTRYARYIKNEYKLCRSCNMKKVASDRDNIAKKSGENHPRYNPELTDEEREKGRHYTEYPIWRTAVYEECEYTCQCCGDKKGGNLIAHHLNGWHWSKNERFEVWNGIVACSTCHDEFHNNYGFKDNTREQFMDFLIDKLQERNLSPASKVFSKM